MRLLLIQSRLKAGTFTDSRMPVKHAQWLIPLALDYFSQNTTLNHAIQLWAETPASGIEDPRQEPAVAFSVNHGPHNPHRNTLSHQEATQTQD